MPDLGDNETTLHTTDVNDNDNADADDEVDDDGDDDDDDDNDDGDDDDANYDGIDQFPFTLFRSDTSPS